MTDSSQDKLVEALRKAVSRTSLLAEGNDPELDAVIRPLRINIAKSSDDLAIQSILNNAEPLLLKVDQARLSRAKLFRDTLHDLIDTLEQNCKTIPQSEKTSLESEIRLHWQSLPSWPNLLKSYLALAEKALSSNIKDQENKNNSLFSRLFRRPSNTDNSQQVIEEICHTLAGFLNNLALSSDYDDKIADIKNALSNRQNIQHLPKLLDEVIALIMIAIGNTQEGLTTYLNELNKQLASINESIVTSYRSQQSLSESREGFNSKIQQQVKDTSQAVEQAQDLDSLKSLINERMLNISETMTQYRQEMQNQEKKATQSITLLKSKVNRMEKDANTLRSSLQEKLAQAMTDALTNLPNRAAYQDSILPLCKASLKNKTPLCLAVCDIDFFKQVNDNWGHLAGDKVLRLVPRQIRNALSKTDLAFRYGGEEFVLVFPSTTLKDAVARAEEIRKEVEKTPFNVNGDPVSITISIGIAELAEKENHETLFSRADKQLYLAKEGGRNRVMTDKTR